MKLNEDLYGSDDVSMAQKEAGKALSGDAHTLDINGETDERAKSEDNHRKQG